MSLLAINGGMATRLEPWPAWPQHGEKVMAAISRVAASNQYHPMFGCEGKGFEDAFAAYHGVKFAVATGNGTQALQAAFAGAGIGCGDEVICPAYTYAATAGAAVTQNARPVIVDSEPKSQGIDPNLIEAKITQRTKAIAVVHPNGYPCDMDEVMAIANKHRLVVIEDCSHAHGAMYKGKLVGTIGHIGAFSLQNKKNLSAGLGGIAITNDQEIAERMAHARNYDWYSIGQNWLISEFHAAIAGAQLPDLEAMNARRRENVAILLGELGEVKGITPLPGLDGTQPVYYNLILQFDEDVVGVSRKVFVDALNAEGIPVKMFYVPLQRWPIFAEADFYGHGCPFNCPKQGGEIDYRQTQTPVADAICDKINLEIKVQPTCGAKEMKQTAAAIKKIMVNIDELKAVACD